MKPVTLLANKFAQIIYDREAMLVTSEQEVQDFLSGLLRKHPNQLTWTTKELAVKMFRDWNESLPSTTLFNMDEKMQKMQSIQEELQSYLIANPEMFHYSQHGWRIDRKRFNQEQASIVTV
jgi:hypothetical protein